MKKEINALLLAIAFPVLYIGGVYENTALSLAGILLTAINALLIIFPPKAAQKKSS